MRHLKSGGTVKPLNAGAFKTLRDKTCILLISILSPNNYPGICDIHYSKLPLPSLNTQISRNKTIMYHKRHSTIAIITAMPLANVASLLEKPQQFPTCHILNPHTHTKPNNMFHRI
jgi:hypothetical protein